MLLGDYMGKSNNNEGNKLTEKCLNKRLQDNINLIKSIFTKDDTLIVREFNSEYQGSIMCAVIYIDSMVNTQVVNENIIQAIMCTTLKEYTINNLLKELQNKVIRSNEVIRSSDMNRITEAIIIGDTVFLLEGYNEALIITSEGWQTRAIEEPSAEMVISGPREGFTESIMVNLTLIRRRLKTPDLKFEFKEIGERSKTKICICYLQELASPKIINELFERLASINIDGILDSAYIEELVQDSPYTPFRTIGSTERPDVVAAKLLEGRIAVFVDGTPFVLTLPFVFIEYFQSNEDYYQNFLMGSINRIIRIIGILLTISVPAIYVSLVTYHQEMIPSQLLLSIAAARKDVPLPTIVEAIAMLFVFEVLRESGARMPTSMGQAITIVGALVLGQAAVEARIISAPMVIVVALTGITGLLIPKFKSASIIIRFIFLIMASILGLYGYIFGFMGLLLMLFSMRSFGVPYMLTLNSLDPQEVKDTIIRAPWWYMHYRPHIIGAKNQFRLKSQNRRQNNGKNKV
ncbi:MAG: spore germination protein [Firmicutes bacterium HGW-Firmicutes-7]|nr:MAG: spore germination protein [Firmicutes bacterium HGW-Firmicutes-7]